MARQFPENRGATAFVPYAGDSTLYVDTRSQSLLVLDASGTVARVMALPKPADAILVARTTTYGQPVIDTAGRLLYRGIGPLRQTDPASKYVIALQPDSAPIVRADFDTRRVDTLVRVKADFPVETRVTEDANGTPQAVKYVNPFGKGDEWAALRDGRVAILRAHDYRLEWIAPSGRPRSSNRLPFDWLPLTETVKHARIDSVRPQLEAVSKAQPMLFLRTKSGDGVRMPSRYDVLPARELPEFEPSVGYGAILVDQDERLWILPRATSEGGANGLLYDVVDRAGRLIDRVRVPINHVVVGFGAGDAVFLLHVDKGRRTLERARYRPLPTR